MGYVWGMDHFFGLYGFFLLSQHGCAGDCWCDQTPLFAFTVPGDQVTARFPDGEQRVGRICSPGGIRGMLAVYWADGSCWVQRAQHGLLAQ